MRTRRRCHPLLPRASAHSAGLPLAAVAGCRDLQSAAGACGPRHPRAYRRDHRERHRAAPAPCPSPLCRPGGGHHASGGAGVSRPRSAERSEGSLDRRSPPSRYTLISPGRAGVFSLLGAPGGGRARRCRAPHPEAVERLKASTATHRTRSASQHSPLEGVGGDRNQWHGRSAAEPVPTRWPPGGRMGEARRSVRWSALPSPRGAGTCPGNPARSGGSPAATRYQPLR